MNQIDRIIKAAARFNNWKPVKASEHPTDLTPIDFKCWKAKQEILELERLASQGRYRG